MSRADYLKALFESDELQAEDADGKALLQKIILLCNQGRLQINGQSPNKAYALGDYLLDDKRLMLDWGRLSKKHRKLLMDWLFTSHQSTLKPKNDLNYSIDESRGLPEEQKLSWWQRLMNMLFFNGRSYTYHWDNPLFGSEYQLSRIDFNLSQHGSLIDFVSNYNFLDEEYLEVAEEYQSEGEPQNIKRLILTDEVIDRVVGVDLSEFDFVKFVQEPHPHAIDIYSEAYRAQRMMDFRESHGYHKYTSFLFRIFNLLKTLWFEWVAPYSTPKITPKYEKFCEIEDGSIYICPTTGAVSVYEKRTEPDTFVFCGGGAKIFGHLGAVEALKHYHMIPKVYAGSSAGAIMACMLFLGYDSDELKKEFRWVKDNLILDYNIDFTGLSTTIAFKQALQNFVLTRVRDEVEKYPEWFERAEAKEFLAENVYQGVITFRTIKQLKMMCPKLNFGEELKVTGTNSTLRRTEIFSYETTPDMEIAEAVKISASLPVIYKPTLRGGYYYLDGGVLNNLPVDEFRDEGEQFIEHPLGASYKVMVFQFDNGIEQDILYSKKAVYEENWLLNTLYSLLTGIRDPVANWLRERWNLRVYSQQTILIKVGDIKAAKFDIDEQTRDTLMQLGAEAATEYMQYRYCSGSDKAFSDEYLSQNFENLEALLIYCAIKKKWQVMDAVEVAIRTSTKLEVGYRDKLLSIKNSLSTLKEVPVQDLAEPPNTWRRVLPKLAGIARMRKGVEQRELKDRSTICIMLFPVLSQEWRKLLSEPYQTKLQSHFQILYKHRARLYQDDEYTILEELVAELNELSGATHLYLYLLGKLLSEGLQSGTIDDIKEDIILYTSIFANLPKSKINAIDLIDDWKFDFAQSKKILAAIIDDDSDALYEMIGRSYMYHPNRLPLVEPADDERSPANKVTI